tara:strand:- start:10031 stop:11158 length:1128 start_codon:yes stop_codon:yes gene_type:complete
MNQNTGDETNKDNQDHLKEFEKIINDLYKDIKKTFPEQELPPMDKEEDYLELYNYCKLVYPKHFFNILYKNEEIFKEDEEDKTVYFLPNVDFRKLWNSNITDKTRDIIWKYLQLVLFLVVNSGDSENMFGEASEIFKAIDQDEFKSKLEKTINEMNDMFNKDGDDVSGVEIPSADDMHSHINGLLDGKLGALAKEIAEQTAKDLEGSLGESGNVDDVFQKLLKDPTSLMKLIKKIGSTLDDKFKSGELKESELLEEASEMLNKMKGVPGMKNIDEIFKKMGMPGGAGKMASGGKIDLGAMRNNLNKNLKNAKMRERMLQKLEEKKKLQEEKVNAIIDNAIITEDKFSTGEKIEKTLISEGKKPKKKKKKKGNKKK